MKLSLPLLQVIAVATVSSAFTPLRNCASLPVSSKTSSQRWMSQWEDEDDATKTQTSFEDAGESLKKEQDNEKLDQQGDYDANPAYKSESIDRVREAIRQRTEALGIEKATMSIEAIKQAEERAKQGIANGPSDGLDLSQISRVGPSSEQDDKPSMLYDPANDMTDEEMKEADPTGQLPIPDQVAIEWAGATWPTVGAALKEVALLVAIVGFTGGLIVGWDNFLRELYTNLNFIPRAEDIMNGSENMVLPEGWTNNMSEEDFMKYQDEVGKAASAAGESVKAGIKTAFPEL